MPIAIGALQHPDDFDQHRAADKASVGIGQPIDHLCGDTGLCRIVLHKEARRFNA